MKITTKRVLAVTITVVCALALTLTIGFFPSGKGNNETISNSDNIQKQTADSKVEVPKGEDYKSMSKEELLAVIEEKDAEIDELVDKVEALTILAEQTTNSIVVPRPSASLSTEDTDSSDDSSTNSGTTSGSSTGSNSTGNSSTSGSSTNGSSSNSSSNGTTSETGL